jgi:phage/plasmid-like protein (TIGR03299 family)
MAANIQEHDQMISARNITPWHGIGEVVEGFFISDLQRIMGWEVLKERLFLANGQSTNTYATTRTVVNADGKNEKIILGDKLSEYYEVLQNTDLINIIEPFIQSGCALDTAGTLGNGKRVWILLRLQGDLLVGQQDVISRYIMISNDHTGKEAAKIGMVGVRVVCQNTLNVAEYSKTSQLIRVRHEGNVVTSLSQVAAMLDTVNGKFLAYGNQLNKLTGKNISIPDLRKYVKEVFFPKLDPSEEAEKADSINKLKDQIEKIFVEGPGSSLAEANGTVYGAYQAVNYFLNHESRGSLEKRLSSIVWGKNQQIDQRALSLALATTVNQ